ncbi:hypothetical protein FGO68_gene11906 [Halteria grandinella]|uniref:Uncharacterized protein n=1 Tax=Halteria grandinella TaxID=5974 RepID=A0A8J8NMT2_HALGN|nr:hypothetical protein FGO68_gene11906 [Halteria grandinella]
MSENETIHCEILLQLTLQQGNFKISRIRLLTEAFMNSSPKTCTPIQYTNNAFLFPLQYSDKRLAKVLAIFDPQMIFNDSIHINNKTFQMVFNPIIKNRPNIYIFFVSDWVDYLRTQDAIKRRKQSIYVGEEYKISLVGVIDQNLRQIWYEEAMTFAESMGIRYCEIDIIYGVNVQECVENIVNETLHQELESKNRIAIIQQQKYEQKINLRQLGIKDYLHQARSNFMAMVSMAGIFSMQAQSQWSYMALHALYTIITIFIWSGTIVKLEDKKSMIQKACATIKLVLAVPWAFSFFFKIYQILQNIVGGHFVGDIVFLVFCLGISLAIAYLRIRAERRGEEFQLNFIFAFTF